MRTTTRRLLIAQALSLNTGSALRLFHRIRASASFPGSNLWDQKTCPLLSI